MERGRYSKTRQGQAVALRKRRLGRVRVTLNQQPQSKKIKTADAIAFQRRYSSQLEVGRAVSLPG